MRRPSSGTATTGEDRGTRLVADDWVRAAFSIMVTDGIAGVTIQRLCDQLGVTKGSFYWHFDDVDTFHAAIARCWSDHGAQSQGDSGEQAHAETAMLDATSVFADPWSRALTRAMRDWAQHDDRARAAIRVSDRKVFADVVAAFVANGFDEDEAEVRAKILYYAGVGFAHVGGLGTRASARQQIVSTWTILTRR